MGESNLLKETCSSNSSVSCFSMSDSLQPWRTKPTRLLCQNSPGKNFGVGCHFLLYGIFTTQISKQVSCVFCIGRRILYHCATWEAQIKPRMLSKFFINPKYMYNIIHSHDAGCLFSERSRVKISTCSVSPMPDT